MVSIIMKENTTLLFQKDQQSLQNLWLDQPMVENVAVVHCPTVSHLERFVLNHVNYV
jgi:hypothetical protein